MLKNYRDAKGEEGVLERKKDAQRKMRNEEARVGNQTLSN